VTSDDAVRAVTAPGGPGLDGLGFPEALRWREGALWFSDMFRSRVVRWSPGEEPREVLGPGTGCPEVPGGLGWTPDGDLLVVDCTGRRLLRVSGADGAPGIQGGGTPQVRVHADLTGLLEHPANDLHVDVDGTAYVGGYGFDPGRDEPRPSQLVRVHLDGAAEAWGDGLVFPNGCERARDGRLVVAETFADRVSALAPSGGRSTLAQLERGSGPDGLSLAPDGGVLVALAFAGAVVRLGAGVVHRSPPVPDGPGAGPTGCYDVAVTPEGKHLAVAGASLDETLAERVDTGTIRLVRLG
jgi:sugar lactone lactonase YvrE